MKVVCINTDSPPEFNGNRGLTLYKAYDVISTPNRFERELPFGSKPYLTIINDFGEMHDYRSTRFITLEEWREKRINKLLE